MDLSIRYVCTYTYVINGRDKYLTIGINKNMCEIGGGRERQKGRKGETLSGAF